MNWNRHHDTAQEFPSRVKPISTVEGPMIPIETLRAQCELVAIDADTDTASGESHPDDPLLLSYLDAAIGYAEDFTGLSIALRTYEMALDGYPDARTWQARGIQLPVGPLISIESFLAVVGGSDGELDLGTDYTIDDYHVPARLFPVSTWPSMQASSNAIKIRFLAGYQADGYFDSDYAGAQMLPSPIRQALLLLVKHFWDYRGDSTDKALASIPNGAIALLRLKKIRLGMA